MLCQCRHYRGNDNWSLEWQSNIKHYPAHSFSDEDRKSKKKSLNLKLPFESKLMAALRAADDFTSPPPKILQRVINQSFTFSNWTQLWIFRKWEPPWHWIVIISHYAKDNYVHVKSVVLLLVTTPCPLSKPLRSSSITKILSRQKKCGWRR